LDALPIFIIVATLYPLLKGNPGSHLLGFLGSVQRFCEIRVQMSSEEVIEHNGDEEDDGSHGQQVLQQGQAVTGQEQQQ
jgi:hypothetical protein